MNRSCVYRIASAFFLGFDREMFDDAISYFDISNTEQPTQEKNASATRDPQRRRTNWQHKKPNEYIRQKPLT